MPPFFSHASKTPPRAVGRLAAVRANLYRAVRRGTLFKTMWGQEPFHWVSHDPDIVEFGSRYGRWAVNTSILSPTTTMLSFGIGQDITFEQALMRQFGCSVIGFDPTPASVAYIEGLGQTPGLRLHAMALADRDGTLEFLLPPEDAADQVSASASASYEGSSSITVRCLTLRSALLLSGSIRADIIKMDIEGAEYGVLDQALDDGLFAGVSQLMVEFHHFLPGLKARQTRQIIARLLGSGFRIGWVGRTNHEYLFLRT
jgi:FkbM family methyltransferase